MTVLTPPVPLATPRRARLGLTLFILALLLAPWVAGAAGEQLLGAGRRFRPAVPDAGARAEHRGGHDRVAGHGLYRLLRRRRLFGRAAVVTASDTAIPAAAAVVPRRAAPVDAGSDPAGGAAGGGVRHPARRADAAAARRLSGDRHARFRRNRAHSDAQSRPPGQPHQRPQRHFRH